LSEGGSLGKGGSFKAWNVKKASGHRKTQLAFLDCFMSDFDLGGYLMNSLLQTGIYSIPEASRLTRVSTWRIRRWLRGYEFKAKHGHSRSPAVWHSQLEAIDNKLALGFLDLLEIRCVDAFIDAGVTWKTLRQVHETAQKIIDYPHPFCTNRFATDGQTIFMTLREKNSEATLLDMRNLQGVFDNLAERVARTDLNQEFYSANIAAWGEYADHCERLGRTPDVGAAARISCR